MPTKIKTIDFERKRPKEIGIAVAEITSFPSHWVSRDSLYYLNNEAFVAEQVHEILEAINLHNNEHPNDGVNLVMFPELSVPEELPSAMLDWSKAHDAIVVAGSHYHSSEKGCINRSPVVISGNVHYITKAYPAPIEKSPIGPETLSRGDEITIFKNTQVGNLSVLICSDFLEPSLRTRVLSENLDLLCTTAFQPNSSLFHDRMHIAAQDDLDGIYLAYSNMQCDSMGDGRSAVFGLTHSIFHKKLSEHSLTAPATPTKLFELPGTYNYAILRLNIAHKRPHAPTNIATEPNVHVTLHRTSSHKQMLASKPITPESLSQFVRTDEISKAIEAAVRVISKREIVFSDVYINSYIPRFRFAKIDSIGQLLIELERHKELLVLFMSEWFETEVGRGLSDIPAGFSTSLLCTLFVIEQGSADSLLNYWKAVIHNKGVGPEKMARQMCSALEAARRKISLIDKSILK